MALQKKPLNSQKDYAALIDEPAQIEVDYPAEFVARITLNVPGNGNRMSHAMRAQLINQLQLNDQDPDVRCTIIRGAGDDFCLGLDVDNSRGVMPFFTPESDGQLLRNLVDGWLMLMDLGKPVITQVHGKCLGTGADLAACSDILYCADNSSIGYPEGRNMGIPDVQLHPWLCGMRNALAVLLTAKTMTGVDAAKFNFATKAVAVAELEDSVLQTAKRVARIPADLLVYNKRSVYRAFEAQGMKSNLRHGVDLETLMFHSTSGGLLTRAQQKASQAGKGRLRRNTVNPNAKSVPKPNPKQSSTNHVRPARKPILTPSPASTKSVPPPKPQKVVPKASPSPTKKTMSTAANRPSTNNEVHFHLHEPVTINIFNDEEGPQSKL